MNIPYKGGLGPLQMVSKFILGGVPPTTLAPKEVDCEISYQLERGTKHSL